MPKSQANGEVVPSVAVKISWEVSNMAIKGLRDSSSNHFLVMESSLRLAKKLILRYVRIEFSKA